MQEGGLWQPPQFKPGDRVIRKIGSNIKFGTIDRQTNYDGRDTYWLVKYDDNTFSNEKEKHLLKLKVRFAEENNTVHMVDRYDHSHDDFELPYEHDESDESDESDEPYEPSYPEASVRPSSDSASVGPSKSSEVMLIYPVTHPCKPERLSSIRSVALASAASALPDSFTRLRLVSDFPSDFPSDFLAEAAPPTSDARALPESFTRPRRPSDFPAEASAPVSPYPYIGPPRRPSDFPAEASAPVSPYPYIGPPRRPSDFPAEASAPVSPYPYIGPSGRPSGRKPDDRR